MTHLILSGMKTAFHREGVGSPAIVLVHGAAYNHRLWKEQIPALSSSYELIAVDLPGHGESDSFPAEQIPSIASYSNHMHGLLNVLRSPPVLLIGHSMGGAVSITYALDHPERVKGLILVGTGAKLGVHPALIEGLSTNFEKTIRDMVAEWSYARGTHRDVIEDGINQMLKCKQDIAAADFKACNNFDARTSIARIQAPTLIIVGVEDRLTPVKWSNYLHANMPNSEITILNKAGHMVMIEKAKEVNEAIRDFIRRKLRRNWR